MAEKFVRFVTGEREAVTGDYIGFFKTAYAMRREASVSAADAGLLNALLVWLDDNMDAPSRFARSKNVHAHGKAVSWFKPSADVHIAKARELLMLMERYGVYSEMITSAKPGIIVYEDSCQIAAIPFKDRDY